MFHTLQSPIINITSIFFLQEANLTSHFKLHYSKLALNRPMFKRMLQRAYLSYFRYKFVPIKTSFYRQGYTVCGSLTFRNRIQA